MRLLYLGGAKSWHNQKWLEFYVEAGHDVHLLSRSSDRISVKHDVRLHDGIHVNYVEEITDIRGLRLFLTLPRAARMLKGLIGRLQPHVVHAHGLRHYGLWGALSGFHPYVVTPIGTDAIIYARTHFLDKNAAKLIYKRCDVITGDSEILLESAIDLGVERSKCHLIQNGVDRRMFHPNVDRSFLRQHLSLPTQAKIVLSPRALTKIYNIDVIIRSIPLVLKAEAAAHFVFFYAFGREYEHELVGLAYKLGVSRSVTFLGYVPYDQMPLYAAGADIAVSVPSSDSSPRSVYEAMAVGTPCILSDIPWTKTHIVHRKNALVVPQRDEEAVAHAVVELLNGARLRETVVVNAMHLVETHMDYEVNMKKMEQIYTRFAS